MEIVIGNFKQLSSSPHHLLKIFNCVKDPNKNVVTKEAFSNLMSKLEKVRMWNWEYYALKIIC